MKVKNDNSSERVHKMFYSSQFNPKLPAFFHAAEGLPWVPKVLFSFLSKRVDSAQTVTLLVEMLRRSQIAASTVR